MILEPPGGSLQKAFPLSSLTSASWSHAVAVPHHLRAPGPPPLCLFQQGEGHPEPHLLLLPYPLSLTCPSLHMFFSPRAPRRRAMHELVAAA